MTKWCAGTLRTGCRLLDVTTLISPFMASYPFKSPAVINDSESRTRSFPGLKREGEKERGRSEARKKKGCFFLQARPVITEN